MNMNILMMPLERNVPTPQHDDWKLTTCPKCGARCWESQIARDAMQVFPNMVAYCTNCALATNAK